MSRLLPIALLTLLVSGCTLENAGTAASSMKDGLTHVGEKVQSIGASEELKNAADTAKGALTTTGEIAIASTGAAKEALTSVGETTVTVGEATGGALTKVGNLVLEAKAALAVPDTAAVPAHQPQQVSGSAVVSRPAQP